MVMMKNYKIEDTFWGLRHTSMQQGNNAYAICIIESNDEDDADSDDFDE